MNYEDKYVISANILEDIADVIRNQTLANFTMLYPEYITTEQIQKFKQDNNITNEDFYVLICDVETSPHINMRFALYFDISNNRISGDTYAEENLYRFNSSLNRFEITMSKSIANTLLTIQYGNYPIDSIKELLGDDILNVYQDTNKYTPSNYAQSINNLIEFWKGGM